MFFVLSIRALYESEPILYSILYPVTLELDLFSTGLSHVIIIDVREIGDPRRFLGESGARF